MSFACQRPHGFMSAMIGVRAEIRSKSSIVKSIPKSRAIATRWSTPFVEPPGRRDRGDGVLERLARHERARRDVVADELHCEPACLVRRLLLVAVDRRDAVRAERREAEEVEDRRHRVGRELAAARTGARAGGRFELVEVRRADLARPRTPRCPRRRPRSTPRAAGRGRARSSRSRRGRTGCRGAPPPSLHPGSSCRTRRAERARRTGDHGRPARSSRRSPHARRARRACRMSPSRRRPRRRRC